MTTATLALTTAESAGLKVAEEGILRAIKTLPKRKQNAVAGTLCLVGGIALIFVAARLLSNSR